VKKFLGMVAMLIVATSVLVGTGTTLAATRRPVYINDQPCYLRDGENNSVYVPTSHIVIWPNGKALLVCVAHDVSNPSRRLVRFDYDNSGGRLCGFEGGVTKDWTIVVTPRGTSTMVCWVR